MFSVFLRLFESLLTPSAAKIGESLADKVAPETTTNRIDLEDKLKLGVFDWRNDWPEFVKWINTVEDRRFIIQLTESLSDLQSNHIRDLVKDRSEFSTPQGQEFANLVELGLVTIANDWIENLVGIICVAGLVGGLVLMFGYESELGMIMAGGAVLLSIAWGFTEGRPSRVHKLTPQGKQFVRAELIPALVLFCEQKTD